jgi:hypothetical protein
MENYSMVLKKIKVKLRTDKPTGVVSRTADQRMPLSRGVLPAKGNGTVVSSEAT